MSVTRREFISKMALSAAGAITAGGLVGCAETVGESNAESNTESNTERAVGITDAAGSDQQNHAVSVNQMSEKASMAASSASVVINGMRFMIELADNDTATAFADMLPMQVEMSELHGNEKYVYLDRALPAHAANPGFIEAGDVMLYGDDCLVIFYESHTTSYSYTRIGKIADVSGLTAAVGKGSVNAEFAIDR